MPPRALLDMKLGGSSSELDGLGDVVVSSILTRMDQLLRQILWRFLWTFEGGKRLFRDPRVAQSSVRPLPQPIFITMLYPFGALKTL
jgi:hypothetical protein